MRGPHTSSPTALPTSSAPNTAVTARARSFLRASLTREQARGVCHAIPRAAAKTIVACRSCFPEFPVSCNYLGSITGRFS